MKFRHMIFFPVFLLVILAAAPAGALKCGNTIIQVGSLKHEVRMACPDIVSTEVIGYIDRVQGEDRIRVMKIEEWVIRISNYGTEYFYSLEFEGNRLAKITEIRK